MNKLLESVIKNRKITLFVILMVFIMGLFNYKTIPKQENPDVSTPFALITAVYPGASPEDVERLVARKIEDEIYEIEGYDFSSSTSMDSIAVVQLMLEVDTNLDEAFRELREKMDDLQPKLPNEVEEIEIETDYFETTGILLSISSNEFTYTDLADYADSIERELMSVEGLQRIEVVGDLEYDLIIEIDEEQLNYYGFSLNDVVNTLKVQNVEIPSGKIGEGSEVVNIKTKGTFESVKEIENVILDVSELNGSTVRIKDVAEVYYDLDDSTQKIKHQGQNAVLIAGYFKENRNIVTIGQEVREKMDQIKLELPDNLSFHEIIFQPETVENSVTDFIGSLLQGVIFVIIVVFLGMGFRNALVVSFAIPMSIMMTFIVMRFTGYEIHQMSITALIIALGMLVDNAIVVSDAIQVRMDEGETKMKAAVNGVKEVAIPVLTSTLTTIAVFMPLMLLNSVAGEFIRSIPMVVMTALTASYLVALFVAPILAYLFFKPGSQERRVRLDVRGWFMKRLEFGLKHKWIVAFMVIATLGGAYLMAGRLGLEFFPKADIDIITMDVTNDITGDLESTEELTQRIAEVLLKEEEVISYTVSIGDGLPKFYYTMQKGNPSDDFAQILVKVDLNQTGDYEKNTQFVSHLQDVMDSVIAGGKVNVNELEQGEPIGAPVRLRVLGNRSEDLAKASAQIQELLKGMDGTLNIEDNFDAFTNEYYVDVDVEKASLFGISKFDVQNEVSIALRGREATIFRKDDLEQNIVVKTEIKSLEELKNLGIKSSYTEKKVLLKEIAEIKLKPKVSVIRKYNREMEVTILSDVRSGYSSVVIQQELSKRLENMNLVGVRYEFDGEEQNINEEFGGVGVMALFALFLIYFILMIQFKSFLQPIVIFASIPLSAVGSILGLWLMGQPLSFTGLLGMVSLFGIVVNNAIVLIDFINHARAQGKTVEEACLEAVEKRFRPITLSTTTTVMGLVPLVLSKTALFTPMAIALMAGLMISTLLTLIVVPVCFAAVINSASQMAKKDVIEPLRVVFNRG